MAYKGQILRNPITGEVVEFLETAKETRGAYSQFKTTLKPGSGFAVEHFHIGGDESFEVLSGTLTYKLSGKQGTIQAGESITLPKGSVHAHWNNHDTDLVMLQTITPSLDVDRFLTALLGLATDNKLDKTGQPPLLQVLLWIRELQSKTYLAAIPRSVQDGLAFLLAPIAKVRGYRAFYEKYER